MIRSGAWTNGSMLELALRDSWTGMLSEEIRVEGSEIKPGESETNVGHITDEYIKRSQDSNVIKIIKMQRGADSRSMLF